MKNRFGYLLAMTFPFLVQCTSLGTSFGTSRGQGYRFEVKGSPSIDTIYFSDSRTQRIAADKVVDSQNETLIFKIRTETTKFDNDKQLIFQKQKTISKEGEGKLNEMGFPELNQTIDFVLSPNGEVVRAGQFPKGSIFYLPQVPLPETPVKVGDTWDARYIWSGLTNHIPLEADLMVIFKKIEKCETGDCALLEISGEVQILGFASEKSDFKSEIKGKILYSLTNGEIILSHIQSTEILVSRGQLVQVVSCVIGEKQLAKEGISDTPICDPLLPPKF